MMLRHNSSPVAELVIFNGISHLHFTGTFLQASNLIITADHLLCERKLNAYWEILEVTGFNVHGIVHGSLLTKFLIGDLLCYRLMGRA